MLRPYRGKVGRRRHAGQHRPTRGAKRPKRLISMGGIRYITQIVTIQAVTVGRDAPRPYTLLGLRPLVGLRQVRAINQSPLPGCTTRDSVGAGRHLARSA
jgi:hypothetical protein